MSDEDTAQTSVADPRVAKLLAEVNRLNAHIDAAFSHVCGGHCGLAREELTAARWGTSRP